MAVISRPPMSATPQVVASGPTAGAQVCLQCGVPGSGRPGAFCRRCGLPYGEPPRQYHAPVCPICYQTADDDGRFAGLGGHGRLDLHAHMSDHDQHPVGDDDMLERLREGDLVRVGRWKVPFDLLRQYLVLGTIDGGRARRQRHDAVLTAMGQLAKWGRDCVVLGDQADWAEARAALVDLMERYHRRAGRASA